MKKELLKFFSELEESELGMLYSLHVSLGKITTGADSLPNVMKSTISNSCGQMTADDNTEYQLQLSLVADKGFWIMKGAVDVAPPGMGGNLFINDDNVN
jgi:hypothetical protein